MMSNIVEPWEVDAFMDLLPSTAVCEVDTEGNLVIFTRLKQVDSTRGEYYFIDGGTSDSETSL